MNKRHHNPKCPSPHQLTAYVLGGLADPDFDLVAEHVSGCPACQKILGELDSASDSVLDRLREASVPEGESPDPPELDGLMRRAEGLGDGVHSADDVPQGFGQYEFVGLLGRGGMGAVHKALHTSLKRFVAVKILPRERASNPEAVLRFQREMEAVGRLSHPNIALAHDAGQLDGTLFLATELIEGIDLGKLVKRHGPLSVADACEVVRQAALGLAHAHDKGLTHRDVKPSNLMISSTGVVKLLDLGLARFRSETAPHDETDTGVWLGTVDYMAPEQAKDPRKADARSDLYSLGCTLFHLLVGQAPFTGQDCDTPFKKMTAHAHQPVPDIRTLRSDVPEQVSRIITRLLEKDPSRRYQTANELVDALAGFCSGADPASLLDVDARGGVTDTPSPDGSVGSAPREVRRVWLAAGACMLCCVVAVAVFLTSRDDAPPAANSSPDETVSNGNREPPPRALAPFTADEARQHQERWSEYLGVPVEEMNSIGMKLTLIPSGEFLMGSPDEEIAQLRLEADRMQFHHLPPAIEAEGPAHHVVITRPFYIGVHEVTVTQFRKFVEATGYKTDAETSRSGGKISFGANGKNSPEYIWSNLGFTHGENHPVGQVTLSDAVALCKWLTSTEGHQYALPTEAQWEFACRAGSQTRWYFGDDPDELGNHTWLPAVGHEMDTGPVGQKRANAFGLYDVYGNAREWCADRYSATYYRESPASDPSGPSSGEEHVLRGGQVGYHWLLTRSAGRTKAHARLCHATIGFRVVRVID